MSKMLSLLPAGHESCFLLRGAFLKRLPTDVRSHLVHDNTSDPLTLSLRADEIHQSPISSASAINHVNFTSDDYSVLAVRTPNVSCGRSQRSPTPGPRTRSPSANPSASRRSDSPDLRWYHRITVTRLRSEELLVPGWETSWPAGGCVLPTCQFYKIISSLPPKQAVFSMFSC